MRMDGALTPGYATTHVATSGGRLPRGANLRFRQYWPSDRRIAEASRCGRCAWWLQACSSSRSAPRRDMKKPHRDQCAEGTASAHSHSFILLESFIWNPGRGGTWVLSGCLLPFDLLSGRFAATEIRRPPFHRCSSRMRRLAPPTRVHCAGIRSRCAVLKRPVMALERGTEQSCYTLSPWQNSASRMRSTGTRSGPTVLYPPRV